MVRVFPREFGDVLRGGRGRFPWWSFPGIGDDAAKGLIERMLPQARALRNAYPFPGHSSFARSIKLQVEPDAWLDHAVSARAGVFV